MRLNKLFRFLLFLCVTPVGFGQQHFVDKISTRVGAEAQFPAFGDQNTFNLGFGSFVEAEYRLLPFFSPVLRGDLIILPVEGLDPFTLINGGIAAAFSLRPTDRLYLRLDAQAGLYSAIWNDMNAQGISFGGRVEAGFRLSPVFTISAGGGFTDYLGGSAPLLTAFSAGLIFSLNFGGFRRDEPKLEISPLNVEPIYPVFYSYYDANSFGSVSLTNKE